MSMSDAFERASSGDVTAFPELYAAYFKKIYYVAYYSLENKADAVRAVKTAAADAYAEIRSCRGDEEFGETFLNKACRRIIERYREYRGQSPVYDPNPSYFKSQMIRLTDAERLSVIIWAVYGYETDKISRVTGLAADVVEKKLKSAKLKLSEKL